VCGGGKGALVRPVSMGKSAELRSARVFEPTSNVIRRFAQRAKQSKSLCPLLNHDELLIVLTEVRFEFDKNFLI